MSLRLMAQLGAIAGAAFYVQRIWLQVEETMPLEQEHEKIEAMRNGLESPTLLSCFLSQHYYNYMLQRSSYFVNRLPDWTDSFMDRTTSILDMRGPCYERKPTTDFNSQHKFRGERQTLGYAHDNFCNAVEHASDIDKKVAPKIRPIKIKDDITCIRRATDQA